MVKAKLHIFYCTRECSYEDCAKLNGMEEEAGREGSVLEGVHWLL